MVGKFSNDHKQNQSGRKSFVRDFFICVEQSYLIPNKIGWWCRTCPSKALLDLHGLFLNSWLQMPMHLERRHLGPCKIIKMPSLNLFISLEIHKFFDILSLAFDTNRTKFNLYIPICQKYIIFYDVYIKMVYCLLMKNWKIGTLHFYGS